MIFEEGDLSGIYQQRYSLYDEAENNHNAICKIVTDLGNSILDLKNKLKQL